MEISKTLDISKNKKKIKLDASMFRFEKSVFFSKPLGFIVSNASRLMCTSAFCQHAAQINDKRDGNRGEPKNEMSHDEEHKIHNLFDFITFIGFLLCLPPSNWPRDENFTRCFKCEATSFPKKNKNTHNTLHSFVVE